MQQLDCSNDCIPRSRGIRKDPLSLTPIVVFSRNRWCMDGDIVIIYYHRYFQERDDKEAILLWRERKFLNGTANGKLYAFVFSS